MAKRASNPDAILDRLSALRQVPSSPEFLAELKKSIGHSSVVVVARGAELASRYEKKELAGDLAGAYWRFAEMNPGHDDKNYVARTGVVRSLVDLYAGGEAADVYLSAVKQGAGRPSGVMLADPAAELRATAAFGLATMAHPEALTICTDLLTDLASLVRVAAARALSASGREGAVLVMRLKLRVGDSEPEVLAECATGLMQLAPAESLDVVAGLMSHREEAARAGAALALGASRLPAALDRLRQAYDREKEPEVLKTILIAAASSRLPAAVEWLVSLVEKDRRTAEMAIDALSPFRLDESVKSRVTAFVQQSGNPSLLEAVQRVFS
ncbi:HEAT repeat domain-containing protein [Humisphaera borealis]|uniref:HEAT repeat domain-containing protein n=1 Tax=Humisphaera borealis TaxID=2807512 RepID=A0A7M2WYY2_9BACT|nr:HEAT repeat domain-containing protein [Humisphaera borealis]QOV90422.1 HEAT repeat domain-containing protein [Humisphaera borealis]